jgi:hypothetical protein
MQINRAKGVAVDPDFYWIPIHPLTPRGVKLQLVVRPDGVAHYGHYSPKDTHWTHYAPLPKFKD